MAVAAITGKKCTFSIGATPYTAWVRSFEPSAEKPGETVATWGEDVAYTGTPNYSASLSFVFDPTTTSLGAALEDALEDSTPVTFTVVMGPSGASASRVFTSWLVTSYTDAAAADGLVEGTATFTGSTKFATTYDTP